MGVDLEQDMEIDGYVYALGLCVVSQHRARVSPQNEANILGLFLPSMHTNGIYAPLRSRLHRADRGVISLEVTEEVGKLCW